jgi:hypothetical protein
VDCLISAGTSGATVRYVDPTGATIFALLPDGSLLLRPLSAPPAGTKTGLKLIGRLRAPPAPA